MKIFRYLPPFDKSMSMLWFQNVQRFSYFLAQTVKTFFECKSFNIGIYLTYLPRSFRYDGHIIINNVSSLGLESFVCLFYNKEFFISQKSYISITRVPCQNEHTIRTPNFLHGNGYRTTLPFRLLRSSRLRKKPVAVLLNL